MRAPSFSAVGGGAGAFVFNESASAEEGITKLLQGALVPEGSDKASPAVFQCLFVSEAEATVKGQTRRSSVSGVFPFLKLRQR